MMRYKINDNNNSIFILYHKLIYIIILYMPSPIIPTSVKQKKAADNLLSALTNLKDTKAKIAKILKTEKKLQMTSKSEMTRKIADLKRRRKKLSPHTPKQIEKKIADLERRLKKLSPLHKQSKKQSPKKQSSKQTKKQSLFKKLPSRDLRKAKENQAIAEEYPDIFMGGRFRKTNKRYKR